MRSVVSFVVLVLLAFAGGAFAQETRPASWDVVVSGSPDIAIPLFTLEKSNGGTAKIMNSGSAFEVTVLRDLGGNRSEYGVMIGSSDGYATMQGHWFTPALSRGAFQLGPTVGVGVGMERDGFRLNSPGLAFHGDLTAAIKAPHGIVKVGAGLDSRKVFALRVSAGVGF